METIQVESLQLETPPYLPNLDRMVKNMTQQVDFTSKLLHRFAEVKKQREIIIEWLRKEKEKKQRMRRELMKNCRKMLKKEIEKGIPKTPNQEKEVHDKLQPAKDQPDDSIPLSRFKKSNSNSSSSGKKSNEADSPIIAESLPIPARRQGLLFSSTNKSSVQEKQSEKVTVLTEKKKLNLKNFKKAEKIDSESSSNSSNSSESLHKYGLFCTKKTNKKDPQAIFSSKKAEPSLKPNHSAKKEEEPEMTEKEAYLEKDRLDKILSLIATQLGPMLDRTGRVMIDSSPHLAMQGQNIGHTSTYSIIDNEISSFNSIYSSGRSRSVLQDSSVSEPIARFLNPMSSGRQTGLESHNLSSGRPLNFELPVMLTPGELLSTNSRQNSMVPENNVHLHINAQVHMPGLEERQGRGNPQTETRPSQRNNQMTQTDYGDDEFEEGEDFQIEEEESLGGRTAPRRDRNRFYSVHNSAPQVQGDLQQNLQVGFSAGREMTSRDSSVEPNEFEIGVQETQITQEELSNTAPANQERNDTEDQE